MQELIQPSGQPCTVNELHISVVCPNVDVSGHRTKPEQTLLCLNNGQNWLVQGRYEDIKKQLKV